jgi:hypothetical protein
MEIPAQKQYAKDPLKLVRTRRGEFVAAALTIILGWIQAGRPMTEVKTLASYDRWSHLTRQPLLWLGMEDPATRLFTQLEHDPDREYLGQLLGDSEVLFALAINKQFHRPTWLNETSEINLELEGFHDISIMDGAQKSSVRFLTKNSHSLLTGPNRGGKSSNLRGIIQNI